VLGVVFGSADWGARVGRAASDESVVQDWLEIAPAAGATFLRTRQRC